MNFKFFLKKVFELAKSVKGKTSPNPAVGAIVVKNNKIVGKGATQPVGNDHAEVIALHSANQNTIGATMFVSMEPCVDYPGKLTPACSQAIIHSGISNVVIGSLDPNPKVHGKGVTALKAANIRVTMFDEIDTKYFFEIARLNEDYAKFITTGLPFVYAKYAMTLDGNIATADGDSQWISNPQSREIVHRLRNKVDAIMVGIGTVLKDNPHLNVRLDNTINLKDPLRIIIDPNGKTTSDFNIMSDNGKTLFIIGQDASIEFENLCSQNNKTFVRMQAPFGMQHIMKYLGEDLQIESLLIEGGGRVLYNALQENIIDKIITFVAPKILGGKGIQPFEGKSSIKMSKAISINDISVENINGDIYIQGYLNDYKQNFK